MCKNKSQGKSVVKRVYVDKKIEFHQRTTVYTLPYTSVLDYIYERYSKIIKTLNNFSTRIVKLIIPKPPKTPILVSILLVRQGYFPCYNNM